MSEIMILPLDNEIIEEVVTEKPFTDEFKMKWYDRYKNSGCTIDQLQRLYNLDKLTEEDFEIIVGEKPAKKVQAETLVGKLEKKISILESENKELKEELAQIQVSIASLVSAISEK